MVSSPLPSRLTRPTLADLVERLGSIPLVRFRLQPPPGLATEDDLLRIHAEERVLCELVDGVLVEKPMAYVESTLAVALISPLHGFVKPLNSGVVTGPDGMMRLFPALVHVPDVAFGSWAHFPDRHLPKEAIPQIVPDLAVEILSPGNTKKEMDRKLAEYFGAGVRLVWIVDPERRTVDVHESPDRCVTLQVGDVPTGAAVLPGFQVLHQDSFAELDRQGA
jgi:Uma2 family endonuclease